MAHEIIKEFFQNQRGLEIYTNFKYTDVGNVLL